MFGQSVAVMRRVSSGWRLRRAEAKSGECDPLNGLGCTEIGEGGGESASNGLGAVDDAVVGVERRARPRREVDVRDITRLAIVMGADTVTSSIQNECKLVGRDKHGGRTNEQTDADESLARLEALRQQLSPETAG